MANTRSAKKRIRQNERRRLRNRIILSRTRTYYKRAHKVLAEGDLQTALEQVRLAISQLDRAVSKGVLHRNNAARRKSRLMKRLTQLQESAGSTQ